VDRAAELADEYTRVRPRLIRIAYALLGTRAEAEDVVSDCWLRLVAADRRERVQDVEAWSTVAVGRAALDVLRSARRRREEYVGPWLPEPVVETDGHDADPAERVEFDETVSYAVMVLLETLTPAERTAWVLHDLFGLPYAEVSEVVGRSQAAVRQLTARARAHIAAGTPRVPVDEDQHRRTVAAFTRAASDGDLDALLKTLDPAVVLTSDGGGKVTAARRPVSGADRVARFLLHVIGRLEPHERMVGVTVNGEPGFAVVGGERPVYVGAVTLENGLIRRVDIVAAPDKLPRLPDAAG
jgi:RNA polymerase sigma-70 factor, ECF subfamily